MHQIFKYFLIYMHANGTGTLRSDSAVCVHFILCMYFVDCMLFFSLICTGLAMQKQRNPFVDPVHSVFLFTHINSQQNATQSWELLSVLSAFVLFIHPSVYLHKFYVWCCLRRILLHVFSKSGCLSSQRLLLEAASAWHRSWRCGEAASFNQERRKLP